MSGAQKKKRRSEKSSHQLLLMLAPGGDAGPDLRRACHGQLGGGKRNGTQTSMLRVLYTKSCRAALG